MRNFVCLPVITLIFTLTLPALAASGSPSDKTADREARRVSLRSGKRGEEGTRGLQHGRERDAGLFDRENARCEPAVGGDAMERFGTCCLRPFPH